MIPRSGVWFASLALSLAVCAASGTASGDAKEAAKEHFLAGMKLLNDEDFAGAAAEFERSLTLYSTKNGMFNLANCYQELGRFSEALVIFDQLENVYGHELDDEMLGSVVRHEKEILAQIAVLEIEVSMSGAVVEVDGKTVGKSPLARSLYLEPGEVEISVTLSGFEPETRKLVLEAGDQKRERFDMKPRLPVLKLTTNIPAVVLIDGQRVGDTPGEREYELAPGKHVIAVGRDGYEPVEKTVEIRPNRDEVLHVDLKAAGGEASGGALDDSQDRPGRLWTWVATGVAGGAAVVGVVTGIAASVKTQDLQDSCDGNQCPESSRHAYDQADNLAKTTNAMIAISAIGAAAAVTLYFTEPYFGSSEEQVAVTPAVAPGSAGVVLQGRF